jgi:putative aldouronate transport system permease protein
MLEPSWGSKCFDRINYTLLALFSLITFLPFVYVVAGSFADSNPMTSMDFMLFPTKFSLTGYQYIFTTNTIPWSLVITVYITVVGTLVNLVFTSLMAYPLSKPDLKGRRIILLLVLFTMMFSGGMIPTFLIVKSLGLLDSLWSLILPTAISAFNLIILKSFFQQLPEEMEDAAKMDGAGHVGILLRIVVPLSLPAMATFGLFYAVHHWNTFFQAVLYINDANKWPIQVWLRQIVILASGGVGDSQNMESEALPSAEVIKMAVIVISTVPILLVYPFLQKHFAKGVLIGSVKG